ncbi:hypothetical protein LI82_02390 [Methanococcoides methylutens]|uniref:Uncharacterized protein n=1 Tax=Methanococcoides methylutens TaxID=2226 RepID=A0A099T5J2_METMT|nr:hypothetical protein [Methanococcoides methylutens]KGK99428.1 hypothetical protein LI82_02390 [Methanococcoides methylutens]
MVKIIHVVILFIVIIGLVGFTEFTKDDSEKGIRSEILNVSYADVTKISIINGLSGDSIELKNGNEITNLINCISGFPFTEMGEQEDLNGYLYAIDFYDERHRISTITIVGDDIVQINGVYYNSNTAQIERCVTDVLESGK